MTPEKTTPDLPSDLQALIFDGRPAIRCSCGFLVLGVDEAENHSVFKYHPCPNRTVASTPWYGYLFSPWGVLIVFVVASAILAGIGVRW